jgi:hypothetical protein
MGMELDRVNTPVSVRDVQLLHVGCIIRQSAFEAEVFFYHLRRLSCGYSAAVMQFIDRRKPKQMSADAKLLELTADTGGTITDTH